METLARLPGWESRLAELCNARRSLPYVYGETDCGSFTQAAIETLTGVRLAGAMPRSGREAVRFLRDHGCQTVEDMMTRLLGDPAPASSSAPGDVVSFEGNGEFHLAVRVGSVALSPGQTGLVVIAPGQWRRAWKVG